MKDDAHSPWTERSFTFVNYGVIDAQLCPKGKSFGVICTTDYLADWEELDDKDYQKQKEEVARTLLNRLEKEYSYDSDLQAKSLLSLGFTTQEVDLITKELNPDPSVFKVEVPLTGYFLIGDNRIVSKDSREVGAFPRENIVGKVIWSGFG